MHVTLYSYTINEKTIGMNSKPKYRCILHLTVYRYTINEKTIGMNSKPIYRYTVINFGMNIKECFYTVGSWDKPLGPPDNDGIVLVL